MTPPQRSFVHGAAPSDLAAQQFEWLREILKSADGGTRVQSLTTSAVAIPGLVTVGASRCLNTAGKQQIEQVAADKGIMSKR